MSANPINATKTAPGTYWTRANIGEATPDILSPMCWSVWEEPTTMCFLQTLHDFGVVSRSEVKFVADPDRQTSASFYGRQATNVDYFEALMGRIPGVKAADYERDVLGSVRSDFIEPPSQLWRLPVILVKAPIAIARSRRRTEELFRSTSSWWGSQVLRGQDAHRDDSAAYWLEALRDSAARFAQAEYVHMMNRFLLSIPQGSLVKLAASVDMSDRIGEIFAGYGGVMETSMADDAWRVARGELSIEEFLADYGYHGPNEGNVYTRSWRENRRPLESVIASYAGRPATARPRNREAAAIAAREKAHADLRQALPRSKRRSLDRMAKWAGNLIRDLERTKASFLMCLDGCRFATRQTGAKLAQQGVLEEADDAFFFTMQELAAVVNGEMSDVSRVVRERREQREEYRALEIPLSWNGLPEPLAPRTVSAEPTLQVTGSAGSNGVAIGTARVLLDPNDDIDLEDGDIIVCRTTDPSWAPLFPLANALVIDSGGPASHGAIVAREMGIPCVIGTKDGTAVIKDGAKLEVDGNRGVVTILS